MLIKLILAAALLYFLWFGVSRLKRLPAQRKKRMLWRGALFALMALLVLGVATGRAHWLGVVIAALIPLLRFGAGAAFRLLPLWMNRGGSVPFRTAFLDIKIELRTGRITGVIRKGTYSGRPVGSLSLEELQGLIDQCDKEDTKAAYLLRHLQKSQQGAQAQHPPPDFGAPARDEALQILGLKGTPSSDEIIAAHKRLIQKLHPDRGGSDFLAARVNQARDVLLDRQR